MNPRVTLAAAVLTAAMAGCSQNTPPPPNVAFHTAGPGTARESPATIHCRQHA